MDESVTYSRDEVRALLRQAAERQAAQDRRFEASKPSELTLDEIAEIAADVGIAPRHVRGAAASLGAKASASPAYGQPSIWEGAAAEHLVDGSLSDANWEAIVIEMRDTFGAVGTTSELGPHREWLVTGGSPHAPTIFSTHAPSPKLHLSARHEGDMTRLRLIQRGFSLGASLTTMAATTGITILIPMLLVTAGVEMTTTTMLLAVLLVVAATLGAGTLITSWWRRRQQRTLDDALDRAEHRCVRRAASPTSAES